jgi:hypothetical protein
MPDIFAARHAALMERQRDRARRKIDLTGGHQINRWRLCLGICSTKRQHDRQPNRQKRMTDPNTGSRE